MEFNEKLYWLFIKASLGQKDAKWEVVEYYLPRIKELCNGDKDMEHNMVLSIEVWYVYKMARDCEKLSKR